MKEPWQIQLFGALRARHEERLITRFRSQQTGSLLAYLAYHRHQSHSRAALIEIFWPESEQETGRHNLSNALSSLRSQLEPPGIPSGTVIIADRFSVELNSEAVSTDVAEFEQGLRRAAQARNAPNYANLLAEAVERYVSPLLPHNYQDWVAPEQERLQQRFIQAASQLINILEKEGEFGRALELAQHVLALDPFREEAHRDIMRLLMAAGRPEDAMRQFHEIERLFAQELGETPSVAIQQFARQIGEHVNAALPVPLSLPYAASPSIRSQVSLPALPTGTVTFLLTDIEGSTALWEKNGDAFRATLSTHHALLRAEFRRNGGQEIKEAGDSFLVAFAGVSDALGCAIACQRALMVQSWPDGIGSLKVRMALNTGDVELEEGEYHGLMLHRAARILSAAHGGQILCSEATVGLLKRDLDPQVHLKDLGIWRLRDVEEPERLFQAIYPQMAMTEFPALNAAPAHRAHLPLQFTRFFGREAEITQVVELLTTPKTRLLTLTGPGGTGKTRLCIESAGRCSETFQGAIWFVPLADLSDPGLIPQTILQAMSIPLTGNQASLEQLVVALTKQTTLLLLDNFEQLVAGGAEVIQTLLSRVPTLQCMVTSRQTLSLTHEERAEAALRLVGALAQFWVMGSHPEGREWTIRALARGRIAPPLVLAKALEGGATFAFIQGDHVAAALLAREEVEFARKTQNLWRLAYALGHMAFLALMRGAAEEADDCMKESVPLAQEVGDRWLIGRQLSNVGLIAWMRRDYQAACALLRQSVEISRALNDQWFLGISLGNLAYVTLRAEGGEAARALHREALLLCQHLGDRYGIGTNLTGIAGVEAEQGRADRAACLLGGAATVLETVDAPLPPLHQREHDCTRQQTQALTDEETFSTAWAEGQAMPLEQAIAYALEESKP